MKSTEIYPFLDHSKDIQKLKCALRNCIYGVFQHIKQELISACYTSDPDVKLLYEGSMYTIEHVCYLEIPNETEPLVSVVLEGKRVRGLSSLNIEELEAVYKLVYSFIS